MSPESSSFVALDYVVFALMLVVSAAVGIYFAWTDRGQSNSGDFLTGGRRLTALPVSLSLTASFMSAITVLSNPAEVRPAHSHSCTLSSTFRNVAALKLPGVPVRRRHRDLCSGLRVHRADHLWGLPARLLQAEHHQHLRGWCCCAESCCRT